MSPDFFRVHWQRLVVRFGQRAMDDEFKLLCTREVHDMSESAFKRFIDVMIGSRPHGKPPLLSEFREARMAEEKLKFQNDVQGALNTLTRKAPEEMKAHLRRILSKEFGGVESVNDALEVAKHQLRVKAADSHGPEGAA